MPTPRSWLASTPTPSSRPVDSSTHEFDGLNPKTKCQASAEVIHLLSAPEDIRTPNLLIRSQPWVCRRASSADAGLISLSLTYDVCPKRFAAVRGRPSSFDEEFQMSCDIVVTPKVAETSSRLFGVGPGRGRGFVVVSANTGYPCSP